MNEQALKERIKFIAQSKDCTFQEVWKLLILERLLVRLAHSKYHNLFIFKGGLLLSYYLSIARETVDIDLLASKIKAISSNIELAFTEICDFEIHDNFVMSLVDIEELEHSQTNYLGFRIHVNARFENMQDRIQVDIAIGDVVEPIEESLELYEYKGKPIFEGSVSLQVYPVETIFSEKLQTIVSRGAANSRMKDFHDVLLLCREKNLVDTIKLKKDIANTFKNRNTNPFNGISYQENDYALLQKLWSSHLKKLGNSAMHLRLPSHISELVEEVNTWLKKNFCYV